MGLRELRVVAKLVHFVLYGVLGFLMTGGLRATMGLFGARLVTAGCLLATANGVTDELRQLFTPRRILERAPNHP
jgi:VanZ family protein